MYNIYQTFINYLCISYDRLVCKHKYNELFTTNGRSTDLLKCFKCGKIIRED